MVLLLFQTLNDLTEFMDQVDSAGYIINKEQLIITGNIPEREIELAINAFYAKKIEIVN